MTKYKNKGRGVDSCDPNCSREETVHVAAGFGPDGPQPPARGESLKKSVTGMGGHNPTSTPHSPVAVQVLKGWKVAGNHLLSRAYDTLQSALVLSSGSSVADGDGGGEDGLDDGSVEVHHHRLWRAELLQLPQEEHPLLVTDLMFSSHFGSWVMMVPRKRQKVAF